MRQPSLPCDVLLGQASQTLSLNLVEGFLEVFLCILGVVAPFN